MSKSERNGVDPEDIIGRYGADTARHFVMFASPPEATLEWSDAGVEGSYRFLKRLWSFAQGKLVAVRGAEGVAAGTGAGEAAKATRREVHLALKQANYDYERVQYNTVVSAGYKMLNALDALSPDAPGAEAVVREGLVDRAARALSGRAAHGVGACGATWTMRASSATCSTRAGPRSTSARSRRTTSSSCCRSTARCAARSSCRRPPRARRSRRRARGRARWRSTPTARR
jgi:leucyl-tRNA synthetase